ncbi:hypothetical protein BLA29_007242, partial [Euroglyphus maynei]
MKLDFRQKLFTIGYKNSLPFAYINDHPDPLIRQQSARGIEPRLMLILSSYFNFTIEYNNFGNMTWDGLYTSLEKEHIDFGMGGTMMTADRIEHFQFLYPHFLEQVTFAILPPSSRLNVDKSLNDLITPFDNIIWICLIATFISMFLFNHLFRNDYRKLLKKQTNHRHYNHNLAWIFVQHLLGEPYPNFRSLNDSMKIITMVCIFNIGIVLTNFYIGILCSRLTLPPNIDLDTIEKFAKECRTNNIITMGIAHTFMYQILQTSKIDTFHAASERMIYVESVAHGFRKILDTNNNREQQFAMIGPRQRLHYRQLEMDKRKSIYIPPYNGDSHFFTIYVAIPVQRTFPDRHTFDHLY